MDSLIMSGRLSSCSVQQDETLAKKMHETPKAPMKTSSQTPRKSERKRALFEPQSPSASEDLGAMSPLSSSPDSSESIYSPICSPNGRFATPTKISGSFTPTSGNTRKSPRLRVEVKSSLYPNLNSYTPKSSRTPRSKGLIIKTPRSLVTDETIIANDSFDLDSSQIRNKDLETPSPKSSKKKDGLYAPNAKYKRNRKGEVVGVAETDSSPSTVNLTPLEIMSKGSGKKSITETSPQHKFHSIPPERFYGPSEPPRARLSLFKESPIKNLAENKTSKTGLKRKRSLSNSSSVSSYCKRSNLKRPSKRNGYRIPNKGVWHAISKPKKKKKKALKLPKPALSPHSRIRKQIELANKRLELIERLSTPIKRKISKEIGSLDSDIEDGIIDSFPDHRIKRKLLPSVSFKNQVLRRSPRKNMSSPLKNEVPDPKKKFMKYGASRRATFTLNRNIKLQISNGVMKLESPVKNPVKKRKLFSPHKNFDFDFKDDKNDKQVQSCIDKILHDLEDEKLKSPCKIQLERITDDQLVSILESPSTKVNIIPATPSKIITQVQSSPNNRFLDNLSSLALNEMIPINNNDNEVFTLSETSNVPSDQNKLETFTVGSILSHTNDVLDGVEDGEMDKYPSTQDTIMTESMDSQNVAVEDSKDVGSKLYSLFYKDNWLKSPIKDVTNLKCYSNKKRVPFVADDQYLLDAGQESIGIVTCQECGFMYQSGDYADEAVHKNFHTRLPDLRFTGWSNERVVGKFTDGRVIMILSIDSKLWWKKVSKIIDIVDQDLGYSETTLKKLHLKTVYLYIHEKAKQVVGCLVAEPHSVGFRMIPSDGVDTCSEESTPCKVGVCRIWTALSHRRQGIATRLMDCLRKTFRLGEEVPLDQIAITVPSPAGKQFAEKIFGRPDILVYGFGL